MTIQTIPARRGVAFHVEAGQSVKVINTHGSQVVDTWAFNAADVSEFLSLEHYRVQAGRVVPQRGDAMATNKRRPILTLTEDTSGGVHDTVCAACDRYRYWSLGHPEDDVHDNCTDNLQAALASVGVEGAETPCPLNLFQNVPGRPDGTMVIEPPVSVKGGHVMLRAEMDAIIVFSACPMDLSDTNGVDRVIHDAHFEVLEA
ncbi:MAG: urea carboxylase-associated family protein [Pseudomonadota bacterium]